MMVYYLGDGVALAFSYFFFSVHLCTLVASRSVKDARSGRARGHTRRRIRSTTVYGQTFVACCAFGSP